MMVFGLSLMFVCWLALRLLVEWCGNEVWISGVFISPLDFGDPMRERLSE